MPESEAGKPSMVQDFATFFDMYVRPSPGQRITRESAEAWIAENETRQDADAAHHAAEQGEPLAVA